MLKEMMEKCILFKLLLAQVSMQTNQIIQFRLGTKLLWKDTTPTILMLLMGSKLLVFQNDLLTFWFAYCFLFMHKIIISFLVWDFDVHTFEPFMNLL